MALKRPVTLKQAKAAPAAAKRRKSFCLRMGGMRKKLTGAKKAADPRSRINQALAAWDCDLPQLLPAQAVSKGIRTRNPVPPSLLQSEREIVKLADQLENKGRRAGYRVDRGASNVSGSRYVNFYDDEGTQYQVRLADHSDKYPNQLVGVGERFSVDPESGNTYNDALDWLSSNGFNLRRRPKVTVPEWAQRPEYEKYLSEALQMLKNSGLTPGSKAFERELGTNLALLEVRSIRPRNPVPPLSRAAQLSRADQDDLARAADLYERFSGHEAEVVGKVRLNPIGKVGVAIGEVDGILYSTVRDGQLEKYIHKFRKADRPLFVVSPDGRALHLVGGNYTFTERGIVDDSDPNQ